MPASAHPVCRRNHSILNVVAEGGLYQMAALEVATGWVPGYVEGGSVRRRARGVSPRRALEQALLPALLRFPCVVTFSGGRDSSAVLAVATDLARREGLPSPLPITKVYPGVAETDETSWQELVIRHLGLGEWTRLEFTDELDLVGPVAATVLSRHDVLWPALVHAELPIFEVAKNGAIITGQGGDEIFGRVRASPVRYALASKSQPSRWLTRDVAEAVAPRRLRRQILEAKVRQDLEAYLWLRPAARDAFGQAILADRLGEPFAWHRSARRLLDRRTWRIGSETIALLARESGVDCVVHPLHDERFIDALASLAGRTGFTGRRAAMTAVFGDLLPRALLERRSKAYFNPVSFTRHSREFVKAWSGNGVNAELVDPDALEREWQSSMPHAGSYLLLQSAWLAGQRP